MPSAYKEGSTWLPNHYFTQFTLSKAVFYLVIVTFVFLVGIVSLLQPHMTLPGCTSNDSLQLRSSLEFGNSLYNYNPCNFQRFAKLLFLTPDECSYARRLLSSVVMGGVIGWERREADRPAGIRTMALVSLGSALFTINSAYAFLDGPMSWDSSRISAAIPSGVGFLGAGLIFKEAEKDEHGSVTHVVHGLTTSASLWLSAAVGVACGGQLYLAAAYGVGVMLTLLRFGPRFQDTSEHEHDDYDEQEATDVAMPILTQGSPEGQTPQYASINIPQGRAGVEDEPSETSSFLDKDSSLKKSDRKSAARRRPNLGSMV